MTPRRLLVIFGASLVLSTLVFCCPTPSFEPEDSFFECRSKSHDVVIKCLGEAAESLKDLSNKSVHMVPFVEEMIGFMFSTICENEAELISVFTDENNRNCTKVRWHECRARLENVEKLERSAFCDFVDPECGDPYTPQFMCRKFLDFLECASGNDGACSEEYQNSLTRVISALRHSNICSQYY